MMLFVLNEEFNNKTLSEFALFLLDCKKEGKTAVVLISSGGGETTCLDGMVDLLEATKVRLITIGMGSVGSCAAALFCCGDERYLLPHTELLIHDLSAVVSPDTCLNSAEIKQLYLENEVMHKRIVGMLSKNTGITEKVFQEKCGHGGDWILTPEEWDKYNIVTDKSLKWLKILEKARDD